MAGLGLERPPKPRPGSQWQVRNAGACSGTLRKGTASRGRNGWARVASLRNGLEGFGKPSIGRRVMRWHVLSRQAIPRYGGAGRQRFAWARVESEWPKRSALSRKDAVRFVAASMGRKGPQWLVPQRRVGYLVGPEGYVLGRRALASTGEQLAGVA